MWSSPLQLFRTVIHSCLHCGVKCSGEADIKGRNANLIFSIPTALDGSAHILHLTSRSFLPLSSVFPIYKGCHSLPLPRSLPELMTYISCRPPHEQGQQRRTTPKAACVCLSVRYRHGASSSFLGGLNFHYVFHTVVISGTLLVFVLFPFTYAWGGS